MQAEGEGLRRVLFGETREKPSGGVGDIAPVTPSRCLGVSAETTKVYHFRK